MKLLILSLLLASSYALYFYLDTNSEKCFTEELAEKTLALAKYRSEQYNADRQVYQENPSLGIRILVKELATANVIKDQKGASSGRVAFTSAHPGAYSICFTTNQTGWFSHELARVHIDFATGDAADESYNAHDEKVGELVMRVKDLNHRIADIRREQQYQREREAEFRDKSEHVNSKALWWFVVQLIVLGITCTWQVRHLKGFFEAKKLV